MNWLKKIYEKLAFQNRYDAIKKWKLSPEIDAKFDEVWKNLPKIIQEALWKLLKSVYDKYGEEAAIVILNSLLGSLKLQIGINR